MTTCYNRFVRWARIGVWDRIFEAISKAYDGDLQMIDSSSIRVHQHGANGKKGGLKKRRPPLGTSLEPAAWGASRGGLTTKIHALVDANGLPILLKRTPGQAHDGQSVADMLDGLSQGQILHGRPGLRQRRPKSAPRQLRRMGQHQTHAAAA